MTTTTQTFKPKAVKPTKYCASCRRGENKVEADYLVKGRRYVDDTRSTPYRAYLCGDHLDIMLEDGDLLECYEIVKTLSQQARLEHAKHLTTLLTGHVSFNSMCHNYPTLRAVPGAPFLERQMFAWLRQYYFEATGRQAAR